MFRMTAFLPTFWRMSVRSSAPMRVSQPRLTVRRHSGSGSTSTVWAKTTTGSGYRPNAPSVISHGSGLHAARPPWCSRCSSPGSSSSALRVRSQNSLLRQPRSVVASTPNRWLRTAPPNSPNWRPPSIACLKTCAASTRNGRKCSPASRTICARPWRGYALRLSSRLPTIHHVKP